MHILFREAHGLDGGAVAEDLRQPPADLAVLSFSDSDLGAFASAWSTGRVGLPSLRLANLARLRHPLSVDLYLENTLSGAKGILVRALGGADYWRYGLHQLHELAASRGIALAVVPGDGRADPTLDAFSTVPPSTLRRLAHLCDMGGAQAARAALGQLALAAGLWADPCPSARPLPAAGFYAPGRGAVCPIWAVPDDARPRAVVVFYRSYLTAADLAPVDALLAALDARGLAAVALFATSLKEPDGAAWLSRWVARLEPAVVVNATAFSARGDGPGPLETAGAPVLQVALSTATRAQWVGAARGLSPADLAMHVALPEVDGRLFAGIVSFKDDATEDPDLRFARRAHAPDPARVGAVADRAAAWARLATAPAADKRIAVVLSTYPGREDQMAHAVGLDAPASAAAILRALVAEGWAVEAPDAAAIIARLQAERIDWPLADYRAALDSLHPDLRAELARVWGDPEADPDACDGAMRLRVIRLGGALVALQPERGLSPDRKGDYHDQRRPPRHAYVAFHLWLRHAARVDALIHVGAHGTLEWLPGKAVALSDACWPEALIGPLPVIYPFIVNDPGEAAMAKRRLCAATLGHMTPPLRPAGVPENLRALEALLDEYGAADGLDPARRDRLTAAILEATRAAGLDHELAIPDGADPADILTRVDAFVCDVKETQYADGLHVYGVAGPCAAPERAALLAALSGRAVDPGPAGSPWRGRSDVLPTGRNLFSVDPRATPSRDAAAEGARMADALVTRHLQDNGDWPRSVVVDLWGSATMRTAGAEFAMALALLGAAPTWDGSGRVNGFEILPLAQLGRPRVDAALRVSGLFRDVFPGLMALYDQAAAAVAAREEAPEDNPLRADGPRVFGPAPGAYGVGVAATFGALDADALAEAGRAWLAHSAHAYGAQDGAPAADAIAARAVEADAFVHVQDLPETDLFMAPDYAAHVGGFAAARAALGAAPASLWHLDATRAGAPGVRALDEEAARVVRARAANPGWIAGMMRHGFRGGAEIAATLDQMAALAHLTGAVKPRHFDLYFEATLARDDVRAFLTDANPAALAEMRRRFDALRAQGLWSPRSNSAVALLAEDA
jgi:cobaltochelatase CobN